LHSIQQFISKRGSLSHDLRFARWRLAIRRSTFFSAERGGRHVHWEAFEFAALIPIHFWLTAARNSM